MNTIKKTLSGLLIIVLIFVSGFFSRYFYDSIKPDQAVQEIKKDDIISNKVIRNLKTMTVSEKDKIITRYDNDEISLDINKISGKGNYKITGIHYDKISSMNVNIQVAKSGNFKFYLGFGLGIAGTGLLAYGAYKIFKG